MRESEACGPADGTHDGVLHEVEEELAVSTLMARLQRPLDGQRGARHVARPSVGHLHGPGTA